MKELISLILVLIFFCSCNENKKEEDLSSLEFRYFNLENAGWKSRVETQKIDNMAFKATLVPIQYYILKGKGREELQAVDSIYEKNKRERVVEFIFEHDSEEDVLESKFTNQDYKSAIEYMSFAIEKDFYLVTSANDTIKCSGVLHERNYKITPYTKIMLFFSDVNPNDKLQLVYKDVLYSKGSMKFSFTDPILNL